MSALACVSTVTLVGVEGWVVDVEAHIASGLPAFVLVGLPDTALLESRDRVRAAVVNSGCRWPEHRVTVNLSPASLPKAGSSFDLAIAVSVLCASGTVPPTGAGRGAGAVLLGELGLDGRLRGVRGVLPAVAAAVRAGHTRVVVPEPNAAEAALVPGVEVLGARSLRQVVAVLRGDPVPDEPALADGPVVHGGARDTAAEAAGTRASPAGDPDKDLSEVVGQATARWALEVSAAGGHHLCMIGAPGSGKTMLAERLPGLLPDLERAAALEVTAVHSVAGVLPRDVPLVTRPPLQAPHHTATVAAVVGGGSGVPRPGAASLAHRGVLLLDEAPEFVAGVLDSLREPMESGQVSLMRSGGSASYPARFRLVLTANPCPCGLAVGKGLDCTCTPPAKRRYLGRLSGPLLDRVDLRLEVHVPTRADIADRAGAEPSARVAERVQAAQERTRHRLAGTPWSLNADVPARELRRRWPLAPRALQLVDAQVARGTSTMRGADRMLRIAWTLADLGGRARPDVDDVAAAAMLRDPVGAAA